MSVLPLVDGVDILVGFRKMNFIFEIKDPAKPPSRRVLTPNEEKFHRGWGGQIHTVTTVAEIIRIIHERVI